MLSDENTEVMKVHLHNGQYLIVFITLQKENLTSVLLVENFVSKILLAFMYFIN